MSIIIDKDRLLATLSAILSERYGARVKVKEVK